MKPRTLTVAAVQLNSGIDREANLTQSIALVERAADLGATYVQLPEYFNYLGPARGYLDAAEPIPGPTTARMGSLAKRRRINLHLGSMLELGSGDHPYNTSVLIGPTGSIVATYRKTHLFDVDVPGAVTHRESDALARGNELVVARLKRFSIGLSVCFDVRFPELYRALAAAGADVLAVPAAFNASTGRSHWHVLIRSRAIENHAFVVAAAQAGTTDEGIATYGHAIVVDPWGTIVAESVGDDAQVVTATLDLDEVNRRRAQIAVMRFRRPTLYRRPVRVIGA